MNCFSFSKTICLTLLLLALNFYPSSGLTYPIPSDSDVIKNFGTPSKLVLNNRLNILVWNLHKGEDDNFSTDFMDLGFKKDLIISQEMLLSPIMTLVFKSFPNYFFSSATSFFIGRDMQRTGVTTAGPVAPTETQFIRTQTLEPIVDSPKVTLVSRYPLGVGNKILTVVNIHGINFVNNSSYRLEMNRIYEAIKKYPAPLIFAGDFNSWNDERNNILSEVMGKLKLKEASFSPDHRMRFNKHPLDHFYYSADLKIVEAKVEEFYQGSDHKPLELIVEYTDTPSTPTFLKLGLKN